MNRSPESPLPDVKERSGNALRNYQEQFKLLELQNKKRLRMARQE